MGFQCRRAITYMEENGLTKEDFTKLPSELPGKSGVLKKLAGIGVIKKKAKHRTVTTWQPGPHFLDIMKAWK